MAMKSDLPKGFSVREIQSVPQKIQSYNWTPDGVLSVTTDSGVLLWDDKTDKWQMLVPAERLLAPEQHVSYTQWSSSGNWLAVVTVSLNIDQHTINVIRRHDGRVKWSINLNVPCYDLNIRELEGDLPTLDIATGKAGLLVWQAGDDAPKRAAGERPKDITCLQDSEQTGILATGYENGDVVLDGPNSGQIRRLHGHNEVVRCFAWSPDGQYLVSGSNDDTVRVWNPIEGTLVEVLDVSGWGGIGTVGFTPDGRMLVACSFAGGFLLWRTDNWQEIAFERDYESYPILGAQEIAVNTKQPQLVSLIDNYSESNSRATMSVLEFDVDTILGVTGISRQIARSPSQADSLAKVDRLGRRDLVDGLAAMLSDSKQGTPFTIGIFGDWGTGKSSLFEQLNARLENDSEIPFRSAFFNAWEFEHTENLPAGLAQRVVESLTTENSLLGSIWLRIQYAWKKHRGHFVGGVLAACAALAGAILAFYASIEISETGFKTVDMIQAAGGGTMVVAAFLYASTILKKVYQHPLSTQLLTYLNLPKYGKHLGLIPVLKKDIETLCELRLGGEKQPRGRLVVFIDDLDRCAPSSVLRVFEAIRLIMDTPNVIVLVALDARMSMQAITHEYKDLATEQRPAEEIARDYIGKIFQLALTLRAPTRESIRYYIEDGLFPDVEKPVSKYDAEVPILDASMVDGNDDAVDGDAASQDMEQMEEAIRRPSKIVESVKKSTAQILAEMSHTSDELEHFEEITSLFRLTNPRLLRRLRNSYRILKVVERNEGPLKLMNMLFWYEYLYTLPSSLQLACENYLRKGGEYPEINPIAPKSLHDALEFITGEFPNVGDYERLRTIVCQLVLPRQKPKSVSNANKRADRSGAGSEKSMAIPKTNSKKKTARKKRAIRSNA